MTDIETRNLIERELREKSWGATEQYLENHAPIYKEGNPVIERIDREDKDVIRQKTETAGFQSEIRPFLQYSAYTCFLISRASFG